MKSHPIPSDPRQDIDFSDKAESQPAVVWRSNPRYLAIYLIFILAAGATAFIALTVFRPGSSGAPTPTVRPIVSVTPTATPEPTQANGPVVVWTQTPTPTAVPTIAPTITPTVVHWQQPEWLNIACLEKIQRLIQQELRGSLNNDAYKFLATQLLYRAIEKNACVFPGWTGGARGEIPPIVSANLNSVLYDMPLKGWPRCDYVVSWAGVQVLLDKRYDKPGTKVLTPGLDEYGPRGLAIGVNCPPG